MNRVVLLLPINRESETMQDMIKFENVSFAYHNHEGHQVQALQDVNFTIAQGEFIAIVGRNGSGKSTFAKHINALLLPDTGNVWVKEMNTRDHDQLWDIRRTAGMVFQNPDNQIVATIVEEDVAFGPENLGVPRDDIIQRVYDSLDIVEMREYAGKAPHMLSGGQKQRVAIAGVLALQPEVVVFDESTAMLDPKGRMEIMAIAKNLHQRGKTVILITHFMDEAAQADRIAIFSQGEIVVEGTPDVIFQQTDKLRDLDLESPPSVVLGNMLHDKGFAIKSSFDIEEMAEAICQLR